MPTPESKIKGRIKKILDSHGAYYFMPVPTGYGQTTVDFLCCINGLFIAIEAKAGSLWMTKKQEITLLKVEKAGGLGFCVNENNVDAFEAELLILVSCTKK